ncbi:MAG: nucleotidyltransferase family protein [Bradyrhizobium sp.]
MTQDEFLDLALRNPANKRIAEKLFELALPDAWIVSGCLVQTVWNALTGRAVDYGIHDYDVFYFDPDTSWAAEDAVIRRLHGALAGLDVKVEARNQARVHLWYGEKHGLPYPPLRSSAESIDRFLTRTTRIGIRRTGDGYDVYAPDGFDDAADLIVRPNPGPNFSTARYEAKAARWQALWPEITVLAVSQDCRPGEGRDP